MWNYAENLGINVNNFIYSLVKKLKTDIVPKYNIDRSVINLNLAFATHALDQFFRTNFSISYKVMDLSKSEDEETNKFERMEINAARINEDINLLEKIIIESTIKNLCSNFNIKIYQDEFNYYKERFHVNKVQTNLTSLFFARYLGNCNTLYKCGIDEYLTLVLILKKILINKGCVHLPKILTGYVDSTIKEKKVVSKKYLVKIVEDERYKNILERKYNASINIIRSQSIIEKVIAILISNSFIAVEFNNQSITHTQIEINEFELIDEILKFLELL